MALRFLVWVQEGAERQARVAEKLDSREEAKRRARAWAARKDILSARVWDSLENMWVYDAFEEFDGYNEN